MTQQWQPVEDGNHNTLDRIMIGVFGNVLNFYFGGGYFASASLPANVRLCRLVEVTPPAQAAVPDEVRETIEDALSVWVVEALVGYHNGHNSEQEVKDRDAKRTAVEAWLEAQRPTVGEEGTERDG